MYIKASACQDSLWKYRNLFKKEYKILYDTGCDCNTIAILDFNFWKISQ